MKQKQAKKKKNPTMTEYLSNLGHLHHKTKRKKWQRGNEHMRLYFNCKISMKLKVKKSGCKENAKYISK